MMPCKQKSSRVGSSGSGTLRTKRASFPRGSIKLKLCLRACGSLHGNGMAVDTQFLVSCKPEVSV